MNETPPIPPIRLSVKEELAVLSERARAHAENQKNTRAKVYLEIAKDMLRSAQSWAE